MKAQIAVLSWKLETYQATGDDFEEETGYYGAEQLSDPVEDASEDGDLASQSQAEGDSRIHVSTWDVGSHCHRHKQRESMANCYRHQPRWVESRISCQFTCSSNVYAVIHRLD